MPKVTHRQAQKAVMQHKLQQLQKLVARFEPVATDVSCILTGFTPIDDYLTRHGGGGLPQGGVHEVVAARSGDMAAALGFAYRLAAQFLVQTAATPMVLYGQTHAAAREGGQPYAPALAAHGLSSENLVYLDGVALPDLLWAGEEALTCSAIGCSILASWDMPPDFTASRRLTLAARAAERPLIMTLGASAAGMATAATTRWQVESRPQAGWHIHLAKSRLSYTLAPPVQGWTVYAHHKPLIMDDSSDGSAGDSSGEATDAIAPLMTTQSAF
jgi:hypothetical protein